MQFGQIDSRLLVSENTGFLRTTGIRFFASRSAWSGPKQAIMHVKHPVSHANLPPLSRTPSSKASKRTRSGSSEAAKLAAQLVALNRKNPAAVDEPFFGLKPALENAVKDHSALWARERFSPCWRGATSSQSGPLAALAWGLPVGAAWSLGIIVVPPRLPSATAHARMARPRPGNRRGMGC